METHTPLLTYTYPTNPQNIFGAIRKHDIHTGIDLFTNKDEPVYSMTKSKVVKIGWFTGINSVPSSPWWKDTQYIICETEWDGEKLYFLYGEVSPCVVEGQELSPGDKIGTITEVLKNDKGLPTTMLHFEVYKSLPEHPVFWYRNEEKPDILLNPTKILSTILKR